MNVQSSRVQATSWLCLPRQPRSLQGGLGSYGTREISNSRASYHSRLRQESIRATNHRQFEYHTMRRITRIQRPSAALAQCLQAPASTPQHTAACRAAATCLRRPRDFSTTPQRPFHSSGRQAERSKSDEEEAARSKEGRFQKQEEKQIAQAAVEEQQAATPAADNAAQQQQPQQQQEAASQFLESYDPDSPHETLQVDTDLVLPPEDVEVAQREDELKADGVSYEPADTAHDLDVVGGLGGWFERDENWGASKRYAGFAPTSRVADPALLELNVRRAVAEALAVAAAAGAASRAADKAPLLTGLWERGGREDAERALALRLEVRGDGAVGVVAKDAEGVVRALRWDPDAPGSAVAGVGEEVGAQQFSPGEAREIVQAWDEGWKKISLHDAQLKFAVSTPD